MTFVYTNFGVFAMSFSACFIASPGPLRGTHLISTSSPGHTPWRNREAWLCNVNTRANPNV